MSVVGINPETICKATFWSYRLSHPKINGPNKKDSQIKLKFLKQNTLSKIIKPFRLNYLWKIFFVTECSVDIILFKVPLSFAFVYCLILENVLIKYVLSANNFVAGRLILKYIYYCRFFWIYFNWTTTVKSKYKRMEKRMERTLYKYLQTRCSLYRPRRYQCFIYSFIVSIDEQMLHTDC